MAATAAEIARLRRMVAEADASNGYSDLVLAEAIARCPVVDAAGYDPASADWTPTYDLNAAAAGVWLEKAAALAAAFDFSADGASYQRSQAAAQARTLAQHYWSRRAAKSVTLRVEINPVSDE